MQEKSGGGKRKLFGKEEKKVISGESEKKGPHSRGKLCTEKDLGRISRAKGKKT